VNVRPARDDERAAARAHVDRAMLQVPDDAERLAAVEEGGVVGSLALDGDEIAAVAVRRVRRGEGVGRALVEAAAARRGRLTAEFGPAVRGFYEALGFDVERVDGDEARLRGTLG